MTSNLIKNPSLTYDWNEYLLIIIFSNRVNLVIFCCLFIYVIILNSEQSEEYIGFTIKCFFSQKLKKNSTKSSA